MINNKLIIAAAGSGKTTYLINEALKVSSSEKVLVTTYTEANEAVIRKQIIEIKGFIPANITIQTWFSFLLQHGAKPYQGCLNDSLFDQEIKGMLLVNRQSAIRYQGSHGPVYWGEGDFSKHYFTDDGKIYSDKISKFVVKCNQNSDNAVIDRIARLYDFIFIDEVQDLAGYDLDFIKLLFKSSSSILLVGDPRQVTYLTHHSRKYRKYSDGKIKDFVEHELGRGVECIVDEDTLNRSHRNNQLICNFSGKLYPNLPTPIPCECASCRGYTRNHEGVFLVKKKDVDAYLQRHGPIQLRWSATREVNNQYAVINLGVSKGLTFDDVLIYPTVEMIKWIKNNAYDLKNEARAKFYVGITRARYSVGIVMDYDNNKEYTEIEKFSLV